MTTFFQDLRYALRMLRKSPAFSTIAIAVLALGIGANTAIFSVVNSVLLKPMPYPNAGRLVLMWSTNAHSAIEREGPSGSNYLDWKEQSRSFEDMAALELGTGVLTGAGEPESVPGARVSANFMEMLGAKTVLGRAFTAQDTQGLARHNVALLTYAFWQRRFASDPAAIGAKITINHDVYTVIGVLDPRVWAPVRADIYAPWPESELRNKPRDARDLAVIGRLKPGVRLEQASAELNVIAQRIAQKYPSEVGWGVLALPLQDAIFEYIRPALWMLLGAVAFVLLLACTNVANLLLARIIGRQRELSIRAAIGAGRTRLLRQMMTESLLLSVLGGGAGMLLAIWGVAFLRRALPQTIPLPNAGAEVLIPPIAVDGAVLLFAMSISCAAAIVFGIVPAFQASLADLNATLKEGGRTVASGAPQSRMRRALVIAETGLAFVLLMGAGLMIKSFWQLQQVPSGVHSQGVLTFSLRLPTDSTYKSDNQVRQFWRRLLDRVQSVPGVHSAGLMDVAPLSQENERISFGIEGRALEANEELHADFRRASPGAFETLGIALREGRYFAASDDTHSPDVAIIDEPMRRKFWPDQNPLGRALLLEHRPFRIVGVVSAVRHYGLDKPAKPTIYVPYLQMPRSRMALVIRTASETQGTAGAVKQAIWSVDPDQPVYLIRSMDDYMRLATSAPRMVLALLGIFAATAVLLAALGIYGVVSYSVSQRMHEFGVRMALGASGADLQRSVLSRGFRTASLGMGAGLLCTWALTPALRWFFYGVTPLDTGVIAAVALVLLIAALLANYFPARRATRIDPLNALRYE